MAILTTEKLNQKEILLYLRWRGSEIPKDIQADLHRCMEEVVLQASPQWTYKVFDLEFREGVPFLPALDLSLPGEDLKALFRDCKKVVFFAGTLGIAVDRLVRKAELRSMSEAVMLDAIASSAIDTVLDEMEQEVSKRLLSDSPLYLTDRFSPGYGDLPLSFQQELIRILKADKFPGLTMTPSLLLVPKKSVTGLFGIAEVPQNKRFRGCAYCSLFETCAYRKVGQYCGQ